MTTTTTDPISATEVPAVGSEKDSRRCHHRFNNGMRCRLPASPSHSGFCPQHFRMSLSVPEPPNDATDLSADLLRDPSEFSSAQDLRQFLARLLVLVTRGGVSPRRAAVLAYITSQLLHSHRAIQKEEASQPVQFIFDLPRPKLD